MRTLLFALLAIPLTAANSYLQHNLVSDQPGMADHVDPHLINPWGLAFSATGPFWIADNSTSLSTVYNSAGIANSLVVSVPTHPTGIVQNSTTDFPVAPGLPASFIFCSGNGTISAWNSSANPAAALVKIDHSSTGAVYTGLAYASTAAGSTLYAANFNAGAVEVYDANFNPFTTAGNFQDPMIPAGYAPFNIWATGNKLYVAFAKQDAPRVNPVTGSGNGYVDLFDVNGSLVQRVVGGGPLNAPWGLAIAPPKFGDFAGALLVGNFGDGTINVFRTSDGTPLGTLANLSGQPISIPGLWALAAGNGGSAGDTNAIYFTAGVGGQSHGLFGSLQAAPVINTNGIVNAASFQLGAAPYTFVTILGSNLAATTRSWQSSDFVNGALPQSLDGVSATIGGTPVYVSYVSPTQLNILLPTTITASSGQLQVVNNGSAGALAASQFFSLSPAFFQFGASGFVAATHADGTYVGPPGMFSSSTSSARPGEVISLWANGFGATNPPTPNGVLITAPLPLLTPPLVFIGGTAASVVFAGVSAPGLYQINVVVPQLDSGFLPLTAQIGSVMVPATMISVQSQD
jgi:uncharacterized protein (TIGR03118 family)